MTPFSRWFRIAPAVLLAGGLLAAVSASAALSDDDNACLGCHGQEGLTKEFGKGETLQLNLDGKAFESSVHAPVGCSACHADVDLKSHPGAVRSYDSLRAFSLVKAAVCQQCHEEVSKQAESSVHAQRIRAGNPIAPTCTGCHSAHAVTPRSAYLTCVGCHSAALAAHRSWLPNATLHQEVVSCAACHARAAARMVDLRLYDPATKAWAAEKPGEPWFEKLANSVDADGKGLGARELLDLMKRINPEGTAMPKTLRGRIELRSNVEAHGLTGKAGALRACDACHSAGAEPFRTVAVSVNGPDGRPLRHAANADILGSASAVASLPEFYAIGGTRSTLLDVLFVLALVSGAAVPIVHLSVRRLLRKRRG